MTNSSLKQTTDLISETVSKHYVNDLENSLREYNFGTEPSEIQSQQLSYLNKAKARIGNEKDYIEFKINEEMKNHEIFKLHSPNQLSKVSEYILKNTTGVIETKIDQLITSIEQPEIEQGITFEEIHNEILNSFVKDCKDFYLQQYSEEYALLDSHDKNNVLYFWSQKDQELKNENLLNNQDHVDYIKSIFTEYGFTIADKDVQGLIDKAVLDYKEVIQQHIDTEYDSVFYSREVTQEKTNSLDLSR